MPLDQEYRQKLFAGAVSALPDFLLKHGPDTISKRLQVHGDKPFWDAISAHGKFNGYRPLAMSMMHGALPGLCYKIMQRGLTYPLNDFYKSKANHLLGPKISARYSTSISVLCGVAVGWSEPVLLLWADHLKVAAQTNQKAQQSIVRYAIDNKSELYRGLGVTMARNTLGSALFFGGTALIKERLDRSQFWNEHPTAKLACATMSGTVLRVAGPYCIDSIKTNVQSKGDQSGFELFKSILQKNGYVGTIKRLYAGASIKLASQALPVFTSWFLYNYMTQPQIKHRPLPAKKIEQNDAHMKQIHQNQAEENMNQTSKLTQKS